MGSDRFDGRFALPLIALAALTTARSLHASPPSPPSPPAVTSRDDPSEDERREARAHMDEGYRLRGRGNVLAALGEFQAADAIMHLTTTGFDVARTLTDLGRLNEALARASEVAGRPRLRDEREAVSRARAEAQALATSLKTRIPTLLLVPGPSGWRADVHVAIDGRELGPGARDTPQPLDPGAHAITVSGAGGTTFSRVAQLGEGQRVTLEVPGGPTAGAPGEPSRTLAASPPPAERSSSGAASIVMWTGFAVGAAGVVAGAITSVSALSDKHAAEPDCPGGACDATGWGHVNDSRHLGNVATVSFVVGGVGIAVGLVALALRHGGSDAPPTRAHLERPLFTF